MKRERPRVGIIYSGGQHVSTQSVNLAKYLGAHLAATGWCTVCLIPFSPGSIPDLSNDRIRYYPIHSSKPVDAPTSDITVGHWNELTSCHVYISCINVDESVACGKKLLEMVIDNLAVTVFAMQRGVRGSTEFKEILSAKKDYTVLECVVGFAVVPHPVTGALISTSHSIGNTIILERLTKEMVQTSDGPVNLLETLPFKFLFQKTLTTSAWGLLLYETIFSLQTVLHEEERSVSRSSSSSYSYDTIAKCLSHSDIRLIYATMLREGTKVLTLSAGEGKWRPDIRAISTNLNLWRLEMLLALPYPFWDIFSYFLGFPSTPLPSPDTVDRNSQKPCLGVTQIEEFLNNSNKQHVELKILSFLHTKLTETQNNNSSSHLTPVVSIKQELKQLMGKSQSAAEVMYWFVRFLGVLSVILVLYFLIIH